MRISLFSFLSVAIAVLCLTAGPSGAFALDNWRISCGADKGSISHTRGVWTFKTSGNHCGGGIFNQRAEIETDSVPPSHKGAYLFTARVAMRSPQAERFGIFQVHDGRLGCAPPLTVTVERDGRLFLVSDIKTGKGESCIRGQLSGRRSAAHIRRDGTEQELKVLIEFTGAGGFRVTIWIDGAMQLSGSFSSDATPQAYKPKKFYFKHGVYSLNRFPYTLTSTGMSVRRVNVRK
ncbi:hypothetical protein [Paracoccus sp. (in: a-proteobacteria)]|jgi:hypothetical protein|uniref:hypothetical protein n=1 Tax=Paracoccus sp. TaxID=267 RepID=UPI0035B3E01F